MRGASASTRNTNVPRGLRLARPLELALEAALRRVAREHPDVFDRLGAYQEAAFLIAPTGSPIAFRLQPNAVRGRVTVVRAQKGGPVLATIRGPLVELVALFAGLYDADAAFFARRIEVEGDTGAVVALHNALEAADLGLGDLIGGPRRFRAPLNAGLAALISFASALRPEGA